MHCDRKEPHLAFLVRGLQDGPVHDWHYAPTLIPAGLCHAQPLCSLQQGDEGGVLGDGGVELNAQGKPKRKRKRDTHQQELNKQAQHRYRCGKQS